MKKYNKFEKKIACLLTKYPKLKEITKSAYQKINYIFYKKKHFYQIEENAIKKCLNSNQKNESFWGYYDT